MEDKTGFDILLSFAERKMAIEFAQWLLINCDTPIFRDSKRVFIYHEDKRHHTIEELYEIFIFNIRE